MRKLNFIVMMTIAAGMILFAAPSAKSSSSDFTFDGSGYLSVFFVGSGSDIHLDWSDPYTNYGERQDVLNVGGNYYVGMQSSTPLTVDRIWIINNGGVGFTQSYQDGYIGSYLVSDGLGILCGSGFSSAVMADASFEMSQYVGRFNPHLISTEVTVGSLAAEGLGCSQMSAQLYSDWYSPSYHIFDYWNDSWVDDSEKTGFVDVELTGDDGLDVDISSSWTTPLIKIETYSIL